MPLAALCEACSGLRLTDKALKIVGLATDGTRPVYQPPYSDKSTESGIGSFPFPVERHLTWPGLPELSESASRGCELCCLLHRSITESVGSEPIDDGPLTLDFALLYKKDTITRARRSPAALFIRGYVRRDMRILSVNEISCPSFLLASDDGAVHSSKRNQGFI